MITGVLNVCADTTMTYPLLAKSSAIEVYTLGSWPEPSEKIRTGHRVQPLRFPGSHRHVPSRAQVAGPPNCEKRLEAKRPVCRAQPLLLVPLSPITACRAHTQYLAINFCSSPVALAFLATAFSRGDISANNPAISASAMLSRIAVCLMLLGLDFLSVSPSAASP
jgi:hypothetical protein